MMNDWIARFREWNRARHTRCRILRALRDDLPKPRVIPNPGTDARRILVIEAMFGLGDAMFANGLVRALIADGREVTVATLERTRVIYEKTSGLTGLYVLENENDMTACATQPYDLVLDLSYVGLDRWPLRIALMKRITAWTVSCSLFAESANAVNAVIDISTVNHMSERMALVFREITGKQVPYGRIRPDFGETPDRCPRVIYVNTVAGEPDRNFSEEQIAALASWFNRRHEFVGLFYTGNNPPVEQTEFVRNVSPRTFRGALEMAGSAFAVVTPDTSIVHAASAADVPVLVGYCRDEPDYFGKCSMLEVWGPMSRVSVVLCPEPGAGRPDRRGVVPVSAISVKRLIYSLDLLVAIVKSHGSNQTEIYKR